MDQSSDGVGGDGRTGDEWVALGRELAAEDAEAFREAREILRELVERVKTRRDRASSLFGAPTKRAMG